MKNIKFVLALLALITGYFWMGSLMQLALYTLSIVIIISALKNFCPLRTLCPRIIERIDTWGKTRKGTIITIMLLVAIGIGGSYASAFFSKRAFLDDFTVMNNTYKQTLFFTGQGNRDEAVQNYTHLTESYNTFSKKYATYRPYALKNDDMLTGDLERVSTLIASVDTLVHTGDLREAHVALEAVRPIFQDVLKRNNFSLLGIALVDFHDAMEKIIEAADAKDTEKLLAAYPEVDEKLKAVEYVANDAEIVAIRTALDAVVASAKNNNLDTLQNEAAALKSAFVKVYLKRG